MPWDPDKPINELPKEIKKLFTEDAQSLLNELKTNKLETILIDTPNQRYTGHKIRAAENSNPPWYRILHNSYPHFRRDRSLKALKRIVNSEDMKFATSISKYAPFKYHAIYRDLILERLTQGCTDEPSFPPNKKAATYFKDSLSNEVEIDPDEFNGYEDEVSS